MKVTDEDLLAFAQWRSNELHNVRVLAEELYAARKALAVQTSPIDPVTDHIPTDLARAYATNMIGVSDRERRLVTRLASDLVAAREALEARRSPIDPVTGRRGAVMQTYSGVEFWPLDPRPDEILIEDISHGLAKECRYGGHTLRHYSVAEHAVIVSLLVEPEFARQALLHDCSEAYTRDLIRPIKHLPELAAFREVENALEAAIFARFGVEVTAESSRAVKEVDDRILVDEVHTFMRRPEMYAQRLAHTEGFGIQIPGLEYEPARELFVSRFADLFPEQLR